MKKLIIICLVIVGGILNIFTTKLFYEHAGTIVPLHVQVSEYLASFSIYPLWSIAKEDKATTRKTIRYNKDGQKIEVVLLDNVIDYMAVNGKVVAPNDYPLIIRQRPQLDAAIFSNTDNAATKYHRFHSQVVQTKSNYKGRKKKSCSL